MKTLHLSGFEFYKIWGKKMFWGVLAVMLSLNIFLLWYTAVVRADAKSEAYHVSSNALPSTDGSDIDIGEIKAAEYQNMLDEIASQAQNLSQISIFQDQENSHFSSRNIQKTAADFEQMRDIKISYEPAEGFVKATNFRVTDILLIGALFVIGSILIYDERKKDMFAVLRVTPGGRGRVMVAKVLAMAISTLLVTMLFFMANLIYCAGVFGLGDLSRSLQSIEMFRGSILPLSVWQYLIVFLLIKWGGAFMCGLLILLVSLLLGHPLYALLSTSMLYGVGILLYAVIPPSSPINMLRYMNPATMLQTNTLFMQYQNFNFFEYPVNMIPVLFGFLAITILLLLIALFVVYIKKKNYRMMQLPVGLSRLTRKMPIGYSLFYHEAHKLFIKNKVLIFILLYSVVMWMGITQKSFYISREEMYYSSYMDTLSGDMNAEKQSYIKQEKAIFKKANKQIDTILKKKEAGEISILEASDMMTPYQNTLDKESVFHEVLGRVTYVKSHEGAKFIYDTGYKKLLLANADESQVLILLLVFVCCFSAVFGGEYKNNAIIILKTTPLGRERTARVKLTLVLWLTFVLGVMYILPLMVRVGKSYGFFGLHYPAMSIPQYVFLPSWIPIWLVLVFHYEVLLLAMAGTAMLLCFISLKLRNTVFSLLVGTLVLAGPILFTVMGLDFGRKISILPFLEAGRNIPGSGQEYIWLVLLLFLTLAVGCYQYIIKRFGR